METRDLFVHIWIMNSQGEILIQRRAKHLKNAPGLWAITGGAVEKGEDSITAIKREAKEELGININPKGKPKRHTRKSALTDIWFTKQDINIEDMILQKEEVIDVKWVTRQTLETMIEKGEFKRYDQAYFDLVAQHFQDQKIDTNLDYRTIKRAKDTDYFIETLSYPVRLDLAAANISRIQFPKSRAVLVRTSPDTSQVTVHIMRDVDLYSSFANFEVELAEGQLKIHKQKGYIEMTISSK